MYLKCIKSLNGFTVGKKYKLLGCAGEYVELEDDSGKRFIIFEGYFDIVS